MDSHPISGKKVAEGIAARFDASLPSPNAADTLNSAERRLVDRIVIMIQSAELGELRVKDHHELGREDSDEDDSDSEWDCEEEMEDEEERKPVKNGPSKEMVSISIQFLVLIFDLCISIRFHPIEKPFFVVRSGPGFLPRRKSPDEQGRRRRPITGYHVQELPMDQVTGKHRSPS